MVAVINLDVCPFLTVSDLTCHFEDTRIGVVVLFKNDWFFCLRMVGGGVCPKTIALKVFFQL